MRPFEISFLALSKSPTFFLSELSLSPCPSLSFALPSLFFRPPSLPFALSASSQSPCPSLLLHAFRVSLRRLGAGPVVAGCPRAGSGDHPSATRPLDPARGIGVGGGGPPPRRSTRPTTRPSPPSSRPGPPSPSRCSLSGRACAGLGRSASGGPDGTTGRRAISGPGPLRIGGAYPCVSDCLSLYPLFSPSPHPPLQPFPPSLPPAPPQQQPRGAVGHRAWRPEYRRGVTGQMAGQIKDLSGQPWI